MIDNKEVYKITIDPSYSEDGQDLGIEQVAFTSKPAIVVKGMAFNLQEPKVQTFADQLKYRITAPAMIPMDIYRRDDAGEYYVQFTEQEIENIFVKFMKDLNNKDLFNLEHNQDITVPAYILESILLNTDTKVKMFKDDYNIDVPKGTLMLTAQITDPSYYKKLVDNNQIGFSIEGFMGLKLSEISENKIKTNMELLSPENEGKMFIVKDGKFVEAPIKLETEVKEEVKEEVVETELETEIKDEVKEEVKEEEVKMAIDETELLTILQPKFDEIYGLIAELKSALDNGVEEEIQEEVELKLSVHQKFAQVAEFLKK